MNNSATSPRAALVARARKHFIAIAATSVALTGGVTAYTAMSSAATQATSTGTSTKDNSSSGLIAPAANAPADGSSNSS